MPVQMIDLVGMNNSFLRPVVADVVNQIKSITNLPVDKTFIITENSGPMLPGSSIGESSQKDIINPTGHDKAIRIEVDEDIDDMQMGAGKPKLEYARPIFRDNDLDISIVPVSTQSTITLSVIARFGSRTEAEQWRVRNRREAQQGRWQLQHILNYHYTIPNELILLLNHIHELREINAPYNESLPEYLKPRFAKNVEVLTDQAGNNKQIVISERIVNAVGTFDFNTIPEKVEKDKDKVVWEIKFNYKIMLERIIGLLINYPVLVHNSFIDSRYIPQYEPGLGKLVAPIGDALMLNLTTGIVDMGPRLKPAGMVPVPYFDDWKPKYKPTAQLPLYMFLLRVSLDDRHDVIDLTQLGDLSLHPLFIPYLQSNPETILHRHASLFNVIIHEDNRALDGSLFTIDSDLKIRSTFELDLRKTYRVVYYITADPAGILGVNLKRLLEFGNLILYAFEHVYLDIFKRRMKKPTLTSDGALKLQDWETMIKIIKSFYLRQFISGKAGTKSVGNYFTTVRSR